MSARFAMRLSWAGLGLVACGCSNPSFTLNAPDASVQDASASRLELGQLANVGLDAEDDSGLRPGSQVCGFEKVDLERRPAEILVVIDRSGSMTYPLSREKQSKWTTVMRALDPILQKTQTNILWGLKPFPSDVLGGDGCSVVDRPEVPPALNNYVPILNYLRATEPAGGTPTQKAIEAASAYMQTRTTMNPRYLLLATDGIPECSFMEEPSGAVTKAAKAGIHTFVVGLATLGTPADAVLNTLADNGLEPRNDPKTRYYPVASLDELTSALEAITGKIIECTFSPTKAPPDPDNIAVDADGMRVRRDATHVDGWDYDNSQMSVALYGSWCDRLKSGEVKNLQLTFGCPGVIIP